jgi:hypothetical protein
VNDAFSLGIPTQAWKYLYMVDDATSTVYLCTVVNGIWTISPVGG